MFSRILVAIDEPGQGKAALDLVRQLATEGLTEVRVLHLRERELAGSGWYARENKDRASFVAEEAIFELRMEGFSAGGTVRPAIVDRVAEAIIEEARLFGADLLVLGRPRRGEFAARLLGSITLRIVRRSPCPVIVAPRAARHNQPVAQSSAPGRHS